jgi:glutaredoxin 3
MLGRIARLFAPAPSVSPTAMSAARAKVDELVKKHKVRAKPASSRDLASFFSCAPPGRFASPLCCAADADADTPLSPSLAAPNPKNRKPKNPNETQVVIFSKTYCPYCVKGKRAMAQFVDVPSADVFLWELDQGTPADEGAAIQDALLDVTGGRSVPRVFVGGQFIGGGDDTAAKASSGELLRLLKAAGVATKA